MATPQMRPISSGTASCPLFLTNFGICAGTLIFVALIHQDNSFSLPGRTAPEQRSTFTLHKRLVGFFPPLSKLSFRLLCVGQQRFLQLTLQQEREMWNRLHTCAHKTQAKLHHTGGGVVCVSGSQPQGYNGKAKNDRTCGLLNILLEFATSCQFQCAGKAT